VSVEGMMNVVAVDEYTYEGTHYWIVRLPLTGELMLVEKSRCVTILEAA
jgi:hypothetical protein